MFLNFFSEPNGNIVHKALMEFDTLRLRGVLNALPQAIVHMLEANEYWPTSSLEDEEADRKDLNNTIVLAEMMIEIVNDVYANKNVKTLDAMEDRDVFERVAEALEALQAAKDVRIAATHAEMGEHFGAATGFQTTNYREDAQKIRDFISKGE